MPSPKIIQFPHAAKIYGGNPNIVAEVMTINPRDATEWLKMNRLNRPLRKSHIAFLASEIEAGNWQVNGQAIVIADDEQILDGQHRLFAIIEAGKSIQSLVVYGITPEAFRTIDTGIVRTGADALSLHYPETQKYVIDAAATAVQWCHRLEQGQVRTGGNHAGKLSNTDVIEYVKAHPTLLTLAETLGGYPKDARPLSLGTGTGLYEMFRRKNAELAAQFMRALFTGEELIRSDPEYLLRAALIRDAERVRKFPIAIRVRMVIKGWNWRRRGKEAAKASTIMCRPDDDPKIRIF